MKLENQLVLSSHAPLLLNRFVSEASWVVRPDAGVLWSLALQVLEESSLNVLALSHINPLLLAPVSRINPVYTRHGWSARSHRLLAVSVSVRLSEWHDSSSVFSLTFLIATYISIVIPIEKSDTILGEV
jgi:hypothetical protein